MDNDAIIRCEKCGSHNIELIYKYPNHLHALTTARAVCTSCGHPSLAMGYLNHGAALQEYVEYYSRKFPIKCSLEEFRQRTVDCVKRQIVQSCLFDENDSILARKDGYFDFSGQAR